MQVPNQVYDPCMKHDRSGSAYCSLVPTVGLPKTHALREPSCIDLTCSQPRMTESLLALVSVRMLASNDRVKQDTQLGLRRLHVGASDIMTCTFICIIARKFNNDLNT